MALAPRSDAAISADQTGTALSNLIGPYCHACVRCLRGAAVCVCPDPPGPSLHSERHSGHELPGTIRGISADT
eukprot:33464-Eustigmatos_ZCMA.PRE.1